MRKLAIVLRRSAKAALAVLAVGPGYVVYLGMSGQAKSVLLERAAPLIRLSFWCALPVFVVVLCFGLLRESTF
jgi:hypothetical protein